MEMPRNTFKAALKAGRPQIGLWVTLADAYAAEGLASAGFDWLLIDGEHAPNDVRSMLGQLQAMAPYPVHPIVRPVIGDVHLIKQILEIGAQTLLVPVVETAEQAALMVAATRYPPKGIRGVGNAVARSSRWNQIKDYSHKADEEMCVLVQVETRAGLENLDAIAAVPGVDGVFFGPSDLSASLGYLGQATHPEVRKAMLDGVSRVLRAGKAPGILCTDPTLAREYLAAGALFVAVGVDSSMLVRIASQLAQSFKGAPDGADKTQGSGGY